MQKTVCSKHEIAYPIGKSCTYCEGVIEDLENAASKAEEAPKIDWAELETLLDNILEPKEELDFDGLATPLEMILLRK